MKLNLKQICALFIVIAIFSAKAKKLVTTPGIIAVTLLLFGQWFYDLYQDRKTFKDETLIPRFRYRGMNPFISGMLETLE